MLILILSTVTFLNLIILHIKYKKGRYEDIAIDLGVLATLTYLSGGTITGLAVATTVSLMISIYLYFALNKPIKEVT